MSGVISQDHTVNGNTFIPGGPVLCPAQDIGVVPVTKEFALIAECTEGQGVLINNVLCIMYYVLCIMYMAVYYLD